MPAPGEEKDAALSLLLLYFFRNSDSADMRRTRARFFTLLALVLAASYVPALLWVPRLVVWSWGERARVFFLSPVAVWQTAIRDRTEYGSVLIYAVVVVATACLFCKYRWATVVVPVIAFAYCLAQGLFVDGFYDG